MTREDKGEWAETAEEGIVPDELSGGDESGPVGRRAESDEPADAEPDLKDVAAAAREQEKS